MRRMNARSPNIALIGLLFIIILLAFKCWTLSSLNDDVGKEVEKLQAEIKISGMRQEQQEKKNQILQASIHELDESQQKLKLHEDHEHNKLQDANHLLKNKEEEISTLKNNLLKKEEQIKDLRQQIEDKENKIEELTSDSQHILSLKNDAEDALSDKDDRINSLMIELEQVKKEMLQKQNEKFLAHPSVPLSIKIADNQGSSLAGGGLLRTPTSAVRTHSIGLQGMKFHPGSDILPRQPSNVKRRKPKYSVADLVLDKNSQGLTNDLQNRDTKSINQHDEILGENNKEKDIIPEAAASNDVLEKPNYKLPEPNNAAMEETQLEENNRPVRQESPKQRESMVLLPPINHENNLDAAVDDERKAVEDPSDDQDEEGKEIKRDLENHAGDNYDNYEEGKADNSPFVKDENNVGEPRGIGAMEVPHHIDKGSLKEMPDDVNLVDDVDQRANERLYEDNFDNNIRNIGRRL